MPPNASQAMFSRALLSREAPPEALRLADSAATKALRFGVHRNNTFASLTAVLAARFPAVLRLIGSEFFHAMATEFVASHPPSTPVLLEYGGEFPAFIARFSPAQDVPYLADVARFEWHVHEVSHAADEERLTIDALAAIDSGDFDRVCLTVRSAARLFRSGYPAVSLWRINVHDAPTPEDISGPEAALIVRPDLSAQIYDLGAGAYAFLSAIGKGRSLADAHEAGQRAEQDFDLASTLAFVFSVGAVVDVAIC